MSKFSQGRRRGNPGAGVFKGPAVLGVSCEAGTPHVAWVWLHPDPDLWIVERNLDGGAFAFRATLLGASRHLDDTQLACPGAGLYGWKVKGRWTDGDGQFSNVDTELADAL